MREVLILSELSGECFYCNRGLTSRCVKVSLIGTTALDGAQAEYVSLVFCFLPRHLYVMIFSYA